MNMDSNFVYFKFKIVLSLTNKYIACMYSIKINIFINQSHSDRVSIGIMRKPEGYSVTQQHFKSSNRTEEKKTHK